MSVALTAGKENELCLVMVRSNMAGRDFGAYGVCVCVFFFRFYLEVVGLEMLFKNQQQATGEEC